MIERPEYLKELKKFKDKDLIKVVTGIRRCGKSTLLEIYKNSLIEEGISKEQIISINLEDLNQVLNERALNLLLIISRHSTHKLFLSIQTPHL